MKYLWPFRAFELLLTVVAVLAIYEVLGIGYDLEHADPSLTITAFVTQHAWSATLAALASVVFGVGLGAHFVIEWRKRGGPR